MNEVHHFNHQTTKTTRHFESFTHVKKRIETSQDGKKKFAPPARMEKKSIILYPEGAKKKGLLLTNALNCGTPNALNCEN